MTTPSLHLHLWAKSDPQHPLWCHLLDVAAVCEALLPRFGGVENIPKPWLLLLVALHDVGKADAQFQNKEPQQKARMERLGLELWPEVTRFRHEARSADWLGAFLYERGWGKKASQVVTGAIRGHHGNFAAGKNRSNGEFYDESAMPQHLARWTSLRDALAALVMETLGVEPYTLDRFQDAGAAGTKLSGLIVLSDWIASNHEQYAYNEPVRLNAELPPPEYWKAAQAEAARAVRRLEMTPTARQAEKLPTFADLWPGFTPRPIQTALEDECLRGLLPGLAIVEAPMGEGKTEGAIYLAECWNRQTGRAGVYFALPTMATSNQMYGRYHIYLERTSPGAAPRLVHGLSWLMDEVSPQEAAQTFGADSGGADDEPLSREWFRAAKRALLSPHGIGTVDQALMAALNVKHGFLRFLGLSAKTLIIDEVHAYDAYMTTLLCRLLSWCRVLSIPVILLSATLSRVQKQQLCAAYAGRDVLPPSPVAYEPYPLLTFVPLIETETETEKAEVEEPAWIIAVPSDPSRDRSLALVPHVGALDASAQTAALAAAQAEVGGCVCIIVNTVVAAQETFQVLQAMQERGELPENTRLLLFHARFRAEVREEIEKTVLALFGKDADFIHPRPQRAILVATQVVEQSLDIDFDVMLSQIAPVDLLLQRSGRVWRHAHHPRHARTGPALHLLLPASDTFEFGGSGRVYPTELLLRTLDLLHNRTEVFLPADFRPLIEACYAPSALPPTIVPAEIFQEAVTERRKAQEHAENEANKHLIPAPNADVFKLAQMTEAVSEAEEGEKASFLHAQTRLGDQTVAALVLHDPALLDLVRHGVAYPKAPPPPLAQMRRLFRQKVNLPAWWLKEASAGPGFEIISKGPKWLRHHVVLGFRNGLWQGEYIQKDGRRNPITIEDHPQEGLRLRDQPALSAEDADANA